MIKIVTEKGEVFVYNPETNRIFKNNQVISSTVAEPLFSNSDDNTPPVFSGILFKDSGVILNMNGKYNPVTDINLIF